MSRSPSPTNTGVWCGCHVAIPLRNTFSNTLVTPHHRCDMLAAREIAWLHGADGVGVAVARARFLLVGYFCVNVIGLRSMATDRRNWLRRVLVGPAAVVRAAASRETITLFVTLPVLGFRFVFLPWYHRSTECGPAQPSPPAPAACSPH